MRMTSRPLVAALVLILATPALAAPKAAKWQAFADCAAAYRANAAIKDPERAASMTAMISETADDYRKAAVKAHRGRDAQRAVAERIALKTATFAQQSRAEVERFIDACPQTED